MRNSSIEYASELYRAFEHFLTYHEASELPCGIILAASKPISEKKMEQLKTYLGKGEPQAAQYFYDTEKSILGVLIGGEKLSYTHFHALFVKGYMQEHDLLAGQILIASFPENGVSALKIVTGMLCEVQKDTEQVGEIRIYNPSHNASQLSSILVVNHDETVSEFLRMYLSQRGFLVSVANNGKEGIEKYLELTPDLVITELKLPIVDGYQLISRIINSEMKVGSHRIIVLTDMRLEGDIKKSFEMGVSDYVVKPFSPIELEARIKRLLA